MVVVTGRRTARDHDDRPTGPVAGDEPVQTPDPARGARVAPGASRGAGVAPQPRPVPGVGRGPANGAALDVEPVHGPADDPEPAGAAPVEVEPTTGAPVDAVPRRVPVRQQSRWHRGARRLDADAPDDEDGAFWAPIEQVHWDGTPVRQDTEPQRDRRVARRAPPRTAALPDPLPGLAALVLLSLVTAFFAWVSAGPFWLAVGHARTGTVVIDECTGDGLTQRCRGVFSADDGQFLAYGVRVSGVPAGRDARGTTLPARMTGPDSGTAYADTGAGRHLRWLPGLLVVAGCAAGIARWTGATRLPGRRHRLWAVTAALAGPALITIGFLAAAW
ncbi:hypothetical protein ACFYPU_06995 [Micromonospora profundi]|uniref:hypothetical protein n=1 Tax=Micromonospora profundi TaxID=1420889 RepID=UPI0036CC0CAF